MTLGRDSGSWPLVGTLYFKQDWTLAHLRPCTCYLSSSQWRLICRTTSPCPGTSRCLLLLPLQVAPQFRVGHLDPLSAGWLTICIAPARRPEWSVRCIRFATGRSRNLTPGKRPVLEKFRLCTVPRQFLLERAILCVTFLSQCLLAERVG